MPIFLINKRIARRLKPYAKIFAYVMFFGDIHAWCQIRTGTLVVLYFSGNKVALAGDSRVLMLSNEGKVTGIYDDRCKITTLGDKALFGGSGFSGYIRNDPRDPAPEYDFAATARQVYSAQPRAIATVAESWGKTITASMNAVRRVHPDFGSSIKGNFAGSGMFVTSTWYNEIRVFAILIDYDKGSTDKPFTYRVQNLAPCNTAIGPYCANGQIDIFMEFSLLASPRAKQESVDWTTQRQSRNWALDDDTLKAIRLVDLTIAYGASAIDGVRDVGGSIDAAFIMRGGTVQWMTRKQECRAQ